MPKEIKHINGKEIELDREIADLIVLMNEKGYTTVSCCSGAKIDHPNHEYQPEDRWPLRPYINCDLGQNLSKNFDKVITLMNCLRGIGHVQLVEYRDEPGIMHFMIEFDIRCGILRPALRLEEFHKRFKEMTK